MVTPEGVELSVLRRCPVSEPRQENCLCLPLAVQHTVQRQHTAASWHRRIKEARDAEASKLGASPGLLHPFPALTLPG